MMDDKGLRRTIVDTLDREPNIDAARIGVAVENGVAILTGHLCSDTEKVAAEQAVRRARGVRAVMSAIAVRDPGRKASDDELSRRALVVADADRRIRVPLLALWGAKGTVGQLCDVLETWREKALDVRGRALDCGHTLQEEAPEETLRELLASLA